MVEHQKKQIAVITVVYRNHGKVGAIGYVCEDIVFEDMRDISSKIQSMRERLKRLGIQYIESITHIIPQKRIEEVLK